MKLKSEKGFTGVDIAISVVVLFIFVSLIAVLIYNFNSSSQEIDLRSKAIEIAIEEIETLKVKTIDEIDAEKTSLTEIEGNEGFYKEITVQDYNEINPQKQSGIVKKVTVKIQYKLKKEIRTVELSTLISREI